MKAYAYLIKDIDGRFHETIVCQDPYAEVFLPGIRVKGGD